MKSCNRGVILTGPFALMLYSVLFLSACGAEVPRKNWSEGSFGPYGPPIEWSFYSTDLRYSGFGLVTRKISNATKTIKSERQIILDAIIDIRKSFHDAYTKNEIEAFDEFGWQKHEWIDGKQYFVKFKPEWIAVTICEDPVPVSDNHEIKVENVLNYLSGYVFPASSLFDLTLSPELIVDKGFRVDKPVHLDLNASLDKYRVVYDSIELFRIRESSIYKKHVRIK
ncbi:hypothetical protein [Planctopirus hydrillae]|nr:hypothetical protein [Planctopirus hydrillae]